MTLNEALRWFNDTFDACEDPEQQPIATALDGVVAVSGPCHRGHKLKLYRDEKFVAWIEDCRNLCRDAPNLDALHCLYETYQPSADAACYSEGASID